MRIVGGEKRGARLSAPKGRELRPTSDRVREALFDILASRISGARFLDLFTGTGAVGIEALSRGAHSVVLVDASAFALRYARRNLEALGLEDRATALRLRLPQDIGLIPIHGGPYDIVFADPPYDFQEYAVLLDELSAHGLVAPEGLVIVEHHAKADLPAAVGGFHHIRTAQYGDTALTFYEQAR